MAHVDELGERDKREVLASAILRRREDIGRIWGERVRALLGERDLNPTIVRASMPAYLEMLADGLRQSGAVGTAGGASWHRVAQKHAEERVRLGFDIAQVVDEFIVLRQILFEVLAEEGVLTDLGQAGRIVDLLEGAISAAVVSYVQFRDDAARRRAAEHVAFITHELKNPLTAVSLGIAKLRRSLPLSPSDERTFDAIERNTRRITELIEGILALERQGERRPEVEPTSIQEILDGPMTAAKLVADAKGLNLEAHFDPNLVVEVDRPMTVSAVDNVLQNALKYTDHGDVRVDVEERPNDVVVHVRDNCPGISKEELEAMFEPFWRGRSGKPGLGLGLAIARRAMQAQGGSITAMPSREGPGCHFCLILPKRRAR